VIRSLKNPSIRGIAFWKESHVAWMNQEEDVAVAEKRGEEEDEEKEDGWSCKYFTSIRSLLSSIRQVRLVHS